MNEMIFLASIAGLYFVLAISPGPNFLVITQAAVSRSRRYALSIAMGVSTASVVWAALAAGGLGLVMSRFSQVQQVLQVLGGAYLLYVGITIFRKATIPLSYGAREMEEQGALKAYRQGLFTNLSNPKTLVFFSGAFASLFTPGLAAWTKVAAVAVVALISVVWNVLMVTVFAAERTRFAYARAKSAVDRCVGILIALFSIKLIFNI